jgi:hypothetical protein
LENARHALKLAFSTYILGTLNLGSRSVYGRVTGEILKRTEL